MRLPLAVFGALLANALLLVAWQQLQRPVGSQGGDEPRALTVRAELLPRPRPRPRAAEPVSQPSSEPAAAPPRSAPAEPVTSASPVELPALPAPALPALPTVSAPLPRPRPQPTASAPAVRRLPSQPKRATPAPVVATRRGPRHADGVDVPPRAVRRTPPDYPRTLRRRAVEGDVEARLLIGRDGRVRQVEILSTTGSTAFGRAVERAARSWRFTPARDQGETVEVWARQRIPFRLRARRRR